MHLSQRVLMGRGKETLEINRGCTPSRSQGERAPLQMPLKELQQPPVQGADGHYHQPPVAYYYVLFSSMDILNWQKHTPLYLEKPQDMIRLLETIFRTHCPTWNDIIQLLVSLRHRILTEARKWLREMAPEGTINWQWWAELATPKERPSWKYNTEEGKGPISAGCFTRPQEEKKEKKRKRKKKQKKMGKKKRPQEGGPKAHEYGEAHRNN